MTSRLAASLLLATVVLMSTITPVQACAIWCSSLDRGATPQEQRVLTQGKTHAHHHDGMHQSDPVATTRQAVVFCETGCVGGAWASTARSLPREKSAGDAAMRLDHGELLAAKNDVRGLAHFEIPKSPGPPDVRTRILRV